MRFNINRDALAYAAALAQKHIGRTAQEPLLAGVLVRTDGDDAVFEATDLTSSVRHRAPVLADGQGAAVLPAKMLADIVRTLPDGAVELSCSGSRAEVACGRARFGIPALPAEDFPSFPAAEVDQEAVLPAGAFAGMARRVLPAARKGEGAGLLGGVLVKAEGGMLRLAATDSFVMIFEDCEIDGAAGFEAVIPGGFLAEAAALADTGSITIGAGEYQITAEAGGTTCSTRRIEGRYPRYQRVVPAESATVLTADAAALRSAVRRVSALAAPGTSMLIDIAPDAAELVLRLKTKEGEVSSDAVACALECGGDAYVAVDPAYASRMFSSLGDGAARLKLNGPGDPFVAVCGTVLALCMPSAIHQGRDGYE